MAQDFLLPSFLMLEINIQSPLQASAPHTFMKHIYKLWGACRIVEFDLDIIFIAKDVKQKTPCAIYNIFYIKLFISF